MERPSGGDEQEQALNDIVRKALEAPIVPDMINQALSAVEGDRTLIVTDIAGNAHEVVIVAPEFPTTFDK